MRDGQAGKATILFHVAFCLTLPFEIGLGECASQKDGAGEASPHLAHFPVPENGSVWCLQAEGVCERFDASTPGH